jgi:hypothetical protein
MNCHFLALGLCDCVIGRCLARPFDEFDRKGNSENGA